MRKKAYITLMAVLLTVSVTGCNMLRGVGKDIENAGGSIQKTVDKND